MAKSHPGFKAVQAKIAAKEGVSKGLCWGDPCRIIAWCFSQGQGEESALAQGVNCPVCGEPVHGRARCIDILKAALRKARADLSHLEQVIAPGNVLTPVNSITHPVSTERVNTTLTVSTPVNRKEYMREYMRKRRERNVS